MSPTLDDGSTLSGPIPFFSVSQTVHNPVLLGLKKADRAGLDGGYGLCRRQVDPVYGAVAAEDALYASLKIDLERRISHTETHVPVGLTVSSLTSQSFALPYIRSSFSLAAFRGHDPVG